MAKKDDTDEAEAAAGDGVQASEGEAQAESALEPQGPAAPEPVATVRMIRESAGEGGAAADVHPDEVENWRQSGWTVAPEGEG